MTQLRSHQTDPTLQGMLYSNTIINGMCQVAQRITAPNLSTTSQYGAVDRFRVHATGTAVNAGTIAQDTAASPGSSGFALKIAGATITGTGIVLVKYRVESKDAVTLKNAIASFACKVRHDVGSGINFTITIRKPTASDNYAATTDIQVGSAVSVANTTNTTLSLEGVSLGDCSNGLEIEIKIECGAVTTKNFWLTEFQLNPGYRALAFLARPYGTELASCRRYCYGFTTAGSLQTNIGIGWGQGTTAATIKIPNTVAMRTVPTLVATAADWQVADGVNAGIDITALAIGSDPVATVDDLWLRATISGGTSGRPYSMRGDGSGTRILVLDAEL